MSDPSDIFNSGAYLAYAAEYLATEAANISYGDNPAYTVDDFLAMYPQFDGQATLPAPMLAALVGLASSCLAQVRWLDQWEFAMGLFIAHYATLQLQANAPVGSTARAVVSQAVSKGIMTSKSVGPVSASYQQITAGWEDWGQWNLTLYGQQLIGMAKLVGAGPIWVY